MQLTDFYALLHHLEQHPEKNLDFGVEASRRPHLRVNWMKTAGGWQWGVRTMSLGMVGGSGLYSADEKLIFDFVSNEVKRILAPLPFKTPVERPVPEWYLSTDKIQQVDEGSIFADSLGSSLTISLE